MGLDKRENVDLCMPLVWGSVGLRVPDQWTLTSYPPKPLFGASSHLGVLQSFPVLKDASERPLMLRRVTTKGNPPPSHSHKGNAKRGTL